VGSLVVPFMYGVESLSDSLLKMSATADKNAERIRASAVSARSPDDPKYSKKYVCEPLDDVRNPAQRCPRGEVQGAAGHAQQGGRLPPSSCDGGADDGL